MSSLDHGPPAPKRTTGPRPRNNQKMRSLDHGMRNVSRGMAGFRSHIRSSPRTWTCLDLPRLAYTCLAFVFPQTSPNIAWTFLVGLRCSGASDSGICSVLTQLHCSIPLLQPTAQPVSSRITKDPKHLHRKYPAAHCPASFLFPSAPHNRSHIRSHEFWFKEETCYRGTLQSWLVTEK